jgi:transposase
MTSVRLDGTSACVTIEGAINSEVFMPMSFEVLIPALRAGDSIVMDNLGAHKNQRTLDLINRAGAQVRFFPAYSPDLNPIEMMWSKVKVWLRKAQARTHPDLLAAIASALRAVTAQDALAWFAACGYSFIWKCSRPGCARYRRLRCEAPECHRAWSKSGSDE